MAKCSTPRALLAEPLQSWRTASPAVRNSMTIVAWVVFFIGALLEVGGDLVIRMGLRGGGKIVIVLGMAVLASYGLIVNSIPWDFSRIFGIYVSLFALMSVLCGRFVLQEQVPVSTWLGLAFILSGALIVQFGRS
jgi:drug/metabolite transporter superfamily protein YnfA